METRIAVPVPIAMADPPRLVSHIPSPHNIMSPEEHKHELSNSEYPKQRAQTAEATSAKEDISSTGALNQTTNDNKPLTDSNKTEAGPTLPLKALPFNQFSSLTVTSPFILKLCSMLSTSEFEHLILWGDNGDTVLVKDLKQFASIVLPNYFKHKNFTSFLRQLNMYGFHTLRQGTNWREFKNDLFKKDGSHDYDKIKRKTAQSNATNRANEARQPIGNSLQSIQQKDSRKRKKDEFKRLSERELKSMLKKQQDVILQLMRRCEANEERIESMQDEIMTLKNNFNILVNKTFKESRNEKVVSNKNNSTHQTEGDLFQSQQGHEYGESYAFDEIEGRQRTLSDTCLSTFTLSNLGLQPQSSSFQEAVTFGNHDNQNRLHNHQLNHHWNRRKSSFDEMSLSFGGFNIDSRDRQKKQSSSQRGRGKKPNVRNKNHQSTHLNFFSKDKNIKRKKKAMRNK